MRDATARATDGRAGDARRVHGPGAVRGLLVTLTVGALGTVGLTACTPDRPDPAPAVQALADALVAGQFDDVPLDARSAGADAIEARRTEVVAGLGEATAAVAAGDVTVAEEGESATAPLTVTWDLPGTDEDWSYEATANVVLDDEDVWRVVWQDALLAPDLMDGETLRLTRTTAERGRVLGADDAVVVEPRAVKRVGIDKTRVEAGQAGAAATALAQALEIDPAEYATRVEGAGEQAFVEAIVVRADDPAYDVAALAALPGVLVQDDELPLAPTRTFARPLLGTVGLATAEIVEDSAGEIAAGDLTGLSGLQRQYDDLLRGAPGVTVEAVPAEGDAVRQLFTTEPVAGGDLRLTLDVGLQERAESVLAGVAPASAIVAIRPSTGEVVAAASGAGGEGLSTATVGQYPPGSTFKVASALAYLRGGLTPDATVSCPATVTVDGRTFQNFPGYPAAASGDVPFRTAFANSCNTAFIGARDTTTPAGIVEAARSLGLDPDVSLGFPSFLGEVPADASGTALAATVIGQGQVLASPLGMATVAASVGAGRTVTPVLVVDAADGATGDDATGDATDAATGTPTQEAASTPATPLTEDEAAALRDMMRAVVTEGGATLLADVPGEPVLAKTGTAQFGTGDDLRNHVWMIAVQGDLAVSVFVAEGDYGSTTAGPLMRAFLVG
ncbi:penicillin-binding transpeptidase domain-containing protein [Cellulomonas oligotrophica]|uniref:Beta-lactamase n=1 Tax=Cellulomonas oligotrophica TaxID=931536 RepID=A0A7Y9FFY6_9CELL|nr:penicillin-binding transpeptidase domain-containing protein [Cellulomonas oligotrophica]NYD86458.1 cell division protein FtsI/penicillin-binding protein 2 [Cellulomonas oligotrophica]GIG32651.1 cell division protein FtsI [Cellulomonas oligotrophica]